MMYRNPLLYEQLVGQYLSDEEIKERDGVDNENLTFLSMILETVDRNDMREMKNEQMLQEDLESMKLTATEDDSKSSNNDHTDNFKNKKQWGDFDTPDTRPSYMPEPRKQSMITAPERNLLREEFLQEMFCSFIEGRDTDVDYHNIDNNEEYDDLQQVSQDAEDRYFDSESNDIENLEEHMKLVQEYGRKNSGSSIHDDPLDEFMRHISNKHNQSYIFVFFVKESDTASDCIGSETECVGQRNITRRYKRGYDDSVLNELKDMLADVQLRQKSQASKFNEEMQKLIQQNVKITESIQYMSDKYDEVLRQLQQTKSENSAFKTQIKTLEHKLETFERNSKASTLELKNVPESKSEDKSALIELVRSVGDVLNVKVLDTDLVNHAYAGMVWAGEVSSRPVGRRRRRGGRRVRVTCAMLQTRRRRRAGRARVRACCDDPTVECSGVL
ncbi:hypothetical protein PYW07_002277 [Mythimna separata]|uniref:CCD97-like C-terminal domain-containing protein n=1 Tax=Mythimna separata TaxID=271217 RepID=A0AAD7YM13_MYTSE|nr:hypothetical protein PYW07_002277 [Mythimna separata]